MRVAPPAREAGARSARAVRADLPAVSPTKAGGAPPRPGQGGTRPVKAKARRIGRLAIKTRRIRRKPEERQR
eukprot:12800737-Alexandrium_andersonii.AAC.1